MLSYLHSFHAGNHADILKHIALIQILRHLNSKGTPYSFFDTHAGSGFYSLEASRAEKTCEAKNGILSLAEFCKGFEQREMAKRDDEEKSTIEGTTKITETTVSPQIPESVEFYLNLIAPYLDVSCYPGSPLIERALMKSDCHLNLCELHPEEVKKLRENISAKNSFVQISQKQFPKTKIEHCDGLKNLFATTPPQIKRGAVLIDPAYEDLFEFDSVTQTVCQVHKKWSAGIIAIWFPLLANKRNYIEQMLSTIADSAKAQNKNTSILRAQFLVDNADNLKKGANFTAFREPKLQTSDNSATERVPRLYGSGMFVLNAPWKLDEQLKSALQFLCRAIYTEKNTSYSVDII